MRGRSKGNQERIIILAHQTEMMAREKNLKPVKSYLRRPSVPVSRNAAVIDMLSGLAGKGGAVKIKRVQWKPAHGIESE